MLTRSAMFEGQVKDGHAGAVRPAWHLTEQPRIGNADQLYDRRRLSITR
ncbi:hypothetical protein [Pseudoruegeria sp. SK021]|nr:hypothetical protein [Pseudoruegeria sp. SK021]